MGPVPLVTFTRGTIAESTHYGSVAVVDHQGALVASAGDPRRVTTMRSSAKPFQAMAGVETGAAERFGMEPADLALVAGSHSGEPRLHPSAAGFPASFIKRGPRSATAGRSLPVDRQRRSSFARPLSLTRSCRS